MITNDSPIKIGEVMEAARAAEAQGNWTEALRLWGVVYERAPQRPVAVLGLMQSLVALGRLEEADMALDEGRHRFPDNVGIAIEHAEIAQKRSEFELAAQRWQEVRSRFPNRPNILAQAGAAFSEMGRFAEADELLAEATTSFPKNEKIAVAYAISAQRQGDAAEALKRWQAVLEQFPDHIEAQAGIDRARRDLNTIEETRRLVAISRPVLDPALAEKAATETSRVAPMSAAWDDEAPASPVVSPRSPNEGFVGRVQRAIRGVLGRA